MEEKKQQLDIELNHDVAQGMYANLAIISHSTSRFRTYYAGNTKSGSQEPDYSDSGTCQTIDVCLAG